MSEKKSFSDWINGDKPVLVDFHATWCGPCKMLAPVLSELAKELTDKVKVIKVDIDKNKDYAQRMQVRGVPTMLLFRNGKVLWRESGFMTAAQIKQSIGGLID